jgi:hypothetical protein
MRPIKRKWLEWPLLLFCIWAAQATDLSLIRLPYELGGLPWIPVVVGYIGFTRDWPQVMLLSFLISFLDAPTASYPTGIYVASLVWTGLFAKLLVASFTFEGRLSFTLLGCWFMLFYKSLTWALLKSVQIAPSLALSLAELIPSVLVGAGLAWLLYPAFVKWDQLFDRSFDEEVALRTSMR